MHSVEIVRHYDHLCVKYLDPVYSVGTGVMGLGHIMCYMNSYVDTTIVVHNIQYTRRDIDRY